MLYAKRRRRELVAGKVGEQDLPYPDDFYPSYQFIRPLPHSGHSSDVHNFETRLRPAIPAPSLNALYGEKGSPRNSREMGYANTVSPRGAPPPVVLFGPPRVFRAPVPVYAPAPVAPSMRMASRRGVADASQAVSRDLAVALAAPNPASKLVQPDVDPLPTPSSTMYQCRPPLFFHSNLSPLGILPLDTGYGSSHGSPFSSQGSLDGSPLNGGNKYSFLGSSSMSGSPKSEPGSRNGNSNPSSSSHTTSSGSGSPLSPSFSRNQETYNIFHADERSAKDEKARRRQEAKMQAEALQRENLRAMEERRRAKEREEQARKEAEIEEEVRLRMERQALLVKELDEIKREEEARRPSLTGFAKMDVQPGIQGINVPRSVRHPVTRSSDALAAARKGEVGGEEREEGSGIMWPPESPPLVALGSESALAEAMASRMQGEAATTSASARAAHRRSSLEPTTPFTSFRPTQVLLAPIDLNLPPRSYSMPAAPKRKQKRYNFDIKAALNLPRSSSQQQHPAPPSSSGHPVFFPPSSSSTQSAASGQSKGRTYLSEATRLPAGKKGLSSLLSYRRTSFQGPPSTQRGSAGEFSSPLHGSTSSSVNNSASLSPFQSSQSSSSLASPLRPSTVLVSAPLPPLKASQSPAALLSPLPAFSSLVPASSPFTPQANLNAPQGALASPPPVAPSASLPSHTSPSPPSLTDRPSAPSPSSSPGVSLPPPTLGVPPVPLAFTAYPPATPVGIIPGVYEPPPLRPLIPDPLLAPFPPPGSSFWEKKKKEEVHRDKLESGKGSGHSSPSSPLYDSEDLSVEPSKFIGG